VHATKAIRGEISVLIFLKSIFWNLDAGASLPTWFNNICGPLHERQSADREGPGWGLDAAAPEGGGGADNQKPLLLVEMRDEC